MFLWKTHPELVLTSRLQLFSCHSARLGPARFQTRTTHQRRKSPNSSKTGKVSFPKSSKGRVKVPRTKKHINKFVQTELAAREHDTYSTITCYTGYTPKTHRCKQNPFQLPPKQTVSQNCHHNQSPTWQTQDRCLKSRPVLALEPFGFQVLTHRLSSASYCHGETLRSSCVIRLEKKWSLL